jgi:glycosyltransferase involved in cell wall biosynthesis
VSRPLHLLHAHSGNLYGGVEAMLTTLVRARHPGLEHSFALCYGGRFEREVRELEAAVEPLGPTRYSRPLSILRARRRFTDVLEELRPDVVLCHSSWSHTIFVPPTRAAGIASVFWLHAPPSGHWLERLARRRTPDFVICNSEHSCAARGPLFADVPATVIHPPVAAPTSTPDAEATEHLRATLDTSRDTVVIIQVSRMEPGKGHKVLLEALGGMRNRPNWTLWQVGGAQRPEERSYLRRLEQRTAALGIADRVRFLGERADVPAMLAASDLFCLPNTVPEGYGIVFVEALYAGLPVVSSATGGALEIVTADCGILTAPSDPNALRGALVRLVDDAALRRRLGGAGPARARELSDPEQQAARLAQALQPLARSS